MNRRNFLKLSSAAAISTPFAYGISLNTLNNPEEESQELPVSYLDFDWITTNTGLLYRIERREDILRLNTFTFAVHSVKLNITTPSNIDLTDEFFYSDKYEDGVINTVYNRNQLPIDKTKIYTNPMLLAAVKNNGYTHIKDIVCINYKYPNLENYHINNYRVQGVTAPGWKSSDGRLPIINV